MDSRKNFDKLNSAFRSSLVLWEDPKQKEYVQLIIRRDFLRSEADDIGIMYHKLFGTLLLGIEREVLYYTKLGLMIEYYQKAINQGEKVDPSELEQYVKEHTQGNESKLNDLFGRVLKSMLSLEASKEDVKEAKVVYRRLAKKIHPDINRKMSENPEIKALWSQIQEAYEEVDVERLKELEILVERKLSNSSNVNLDLEIPDIEAKIKKLQSEIYSIVTTKPYVLMSVIIPEENAEMERERLEKMLAMYRSMCKGREEVLEEKKREVENE